MTSFSPVAILKQPEKINPLESLSCIICLCASTEKLLEYKSEVTTERIISKCKKHDAPALKTGKYNDLIRKLKVAN